MSFFDAVAAETRAQGPTCGLPAILAALPPDQAAEVRAAIYGAEYKISAVVRAANNANIPISKGTIERHRRNECMTCRSSRT
jgi:hypothetical protein